MHAGIDPKTGGFTGVNKFLRVNRLTAVRFGLICVFYMIRTRTAKRSLNAKRYDENGKKHLEYR